MTQGPSRSHRASPSHPEKPHHALPTSLTSLIGRRAELEEVEALLAERRLVSLVGAPGVGKTRLATEAASQASAHHPDGLWLVDLAQVSEPGLVAQVVATALSVREQRAESMTEAIVRNLGHRRCLLVLDNCEHVARSCAELICVLLAACPYLTVLATSREPLGAAGEAVRVVPPLAVPDPGGSTMDIGESEAVRLFVARVPTGLILTDDTAPVVSHICRRLDGIPLAIELAGHRVGEFTPHEVAARLDDRFELLRSELAGVPLRHQCLYTALEWSHDLLTVAEAALLRRLAVFAGSFDEDAVRQICVGEQVKTEAVGRLLCGLANRSLVAGEVVGLRTHYSLHETIRHYARSKLIVVEEELAYLENHARWCEDLAEQADTEQAAQGSAFCMAKLAANAAELRAALAWSLEHNVNLALSLAGSASRYWLAHGQLQEGREWLAKALSAATGPSDGRAKALWGAAFMACLTGDSAAVLPASEEALHLAQEAGDLRTTARVLNLLGVFRVLTDPAEAPGVLTEAVSLSRQSGEKTTLVASLGMLGFTHYLSGNLAKANEALEEGVRIGRTLGDSQPLAIGFVSWGTVKHQCGDLECARTLLEDGILVARRIGDPLWTAVGLGFLAELTAAEGSYQSARQVAEEAIRTARCTGSSPVMALCLAIGAELDLETSNHADCLQPLQDALAIAHSGKFTDLHSRVLVGLGRVRLHCGELDAAKLLFEEGLVIAETTDSPLATAKALHWFARLTAAQGDWPSTLGLDMEALGLQARVGQLVALPSSFEAVARSIAKMGDEVRAARILGAAESLRARTVVVPSAYEQTERAETVALLGERLDPTEHEAARGAGARLTPQEAVSYARRSRGPRRRPAWGWTSLTPTERRVVDLVAEGLKNREVGECLFMSHRTVQTHLAKVYRKLHLRSRTELAREVARRSQPDEAANVETHLRHERG